jgi:molybdenum cofactor biosynthesis enzyme MoaA
MNVMTPDQVGGIASTEVCDLSCVMCHFNGPLAPRKSATITPEEGLAFMRAILKGLL